MHKDATSVGPRRSYGGVPECGYWPVVRQLERALGGRPGYPVPARLIGVIRVGVAREGRLRAARGRGIPIACARPKTALFWRMQLGRLRTERSVAVAVVV